ncbi:MAG TPA: recombinase family protein [Vicinamibacterales bacterium]|nr:recombinase family protein [Vicinamibacterales bacterium]
MKQLFAYIRVSDPKQGKGVSLDEQRSIIEAYAVRIGAAIVEWFVEKKTAAKAGRPQFDRMVKLLRQGKAEGVVIHKVDRSTRNFRDWADIDELIEGGVDIHFANEQMDLRSDGGRLAADIQMVFAVQYIRNLRQETLKGIHGRLKQGILPHSAPIGYLDCGAGKPKAIDPVRGPLIRALFDRYATGASTLRTLTEEAAAAGLRNRNGNPLRLTQIHAMLRNPFYAGVLRSARFGVFPGAHEPLVKKATFDRVQAVLAGKFIRRTKRHVLLFRRLLHCKTCGRSLIGSERKGNVYYRCSNVECPTTSVREDAVEEAVIELLAAIRLDEAEATAIEAEIGEYDRNHIAVEEARRASLTEALSAANARMTRLTDLLLDGKIDATAHDAKRAELIVERQELERGLAAVEDGTKELVKRTRQIVELAQHAENIYRIGDHERKRRLLETVLSNCVVTGKTLEFSLLEPFASFAKRTSEQMCAPDWYTARTFSLEELLKWSAALLGKLRGCP